MGIFISLSYLELDFSLKGIKIIHEHSPSLYLVDMAPIVLPAVAFIVTRLAKKETQKVLSEDESEKIEEISVAIRELQNENFKNEINLSGNLDKVGKSIESLKGTLVQNKTKEEQKLWESNGLAEFGALLRNSNDGIEKMLSDFIKELVKYIDAQFGGVFIINDSRKVHKLELIGSYAYEGDIAKSTFEIKEGLVGQCFYNKEIMFFDELPQNYDYNIKSGFGDSKPTSMLLCPIITNEEMIGVVELASLYKIEKHQIEFVKKISESVAIFVKNIKSSQQTKDLLEESQFMAEQLQVQEEELRQNAEELQATQEEIQRKLNETEHVLNAERKKITSIVNTSSDAILVINESGKINDFNPAFQKLVGYSNSEIEKHSLKKLLGIEEDAKTFIKNNLGEVVEIKIRDKNENEIWVKISTNQMDLDGEISYGLFISDISELKHNIDVMEESMLEFQNLMMEQSESQAQLEMELAATKEELENLKKQ